MSNDTPVQHYDFLAAALVPTNEQRMVTALEQIVVLLTPKTPYADLKLAQASAVQEPPKAQAAVAKKPFGRK